MDKILVSEKGEILDKNTKVFSKEVLMKRTASQIENNIIKKKKDDLVVNEEIKILNRKSIFSLKSKSLSEPQPECSSKPNTISESRPECSSKSNNISEPRPECSSKSSTISKPREECSSKSNSIVLTDNIDDDQLVAENSANSPGYLILLPDGKICTIMYLYLFLVPLR